MDCGVIAPQSLDELAPSWALVDELGDELSFGDRDHDRQGAAICTAFGAVDGRCRGIVLEHAKVLVDAFGRLSPLTTNDELERIFAELIGCAEIDLVAHTKTVAARARGSKER